MRSTACKLCMLSRIDELLVGRGDETDFANNPIILAESAYLAHSSQSSALSAQSA